jgi:crossover junction endodeoxyribonuclease RuvC
MANTIRLLGLDPGLRKTGWGVIDVEGARLSWVAHGVISPDDKAPFSDRLLCLFEGITGVIDTYAPHEAAVEETFLNTNAQSTLKGCWSPNTAPRRSRSPSSAPAGPTRPRSPT